MRLSRAQCVTMFGLVMGFTPDAIVEFIDQNEDRVIAKVVNRYGERGFELPHNGGFDEITAMRRSSKELRELLGKPDPKALEQPISNDEILGTS